MQRLTALLVVLFAVVAAGRAVAASIFGEVIGVEDPMAIKPGEPITLLITVDTQGEVFDAFVMIFRVDRYGLSADPMPMEQNPNVPFVFQRDGRFFRVGAPMPEESGVVPVLVLPFGLLRENVPFALDVRVGVPPEEYEGIRVARTEDEFLEHRAEGVSLGRELKAIPELTTAVFVAIGLAGMVPMHRSRRRVRHDHVA